MRAVGGQPCDFRVAQVRPHLRPPRQQDQSAQRHPLAPRVQPGLVHHPRDRHVVLLVERRHRVDHYRVPVDHAQLGNRDTAHRVSGAARVRRRQCDVHHGARRPPWAATRFGEQAVHRQPLERGVGAESARRMQQVRQRLAPLQLVDPGSHDGPRHLRPRLIRRHEHHVSRLEPHVVARVAAQQVVVQIERGHRLATALHGNRAHVGALGHPARGVQRRHRGAERADLIGAGLGHLARDEDLIGAHIDDRHVEARGGVRRPPHPGVHATQPAEQHVAHLLERQVGYVHLPHLGDQDVPLTHHLQRVGQLHISREDQREHVARPDAVIRRHGAREQRQELGL